jgi:hypothetical protein
MLERFLQLESRTRKFIPMFIKHQKFYTRQQNYNRMLSTILILSFHFAHKLLINSTV